MNNEVVRKRWARLLVGVCAVAVFVFVFIPTVNTLVYTSNMESLREYSLQCAISVENEITSQVEKMKTIASSTELSRNTKVEEKQSYVSKLAEKLDYYELYYIDAMDKMIRLPSKVPTDVSDRDYVNGALEGKDYFIPVLRSRVIDKDITLISVPVYSGVEVVGALVSSTEVSGASELVEGIIASRRTKAFILDREGQLISTNDHTIRELASSERNSQQWSELQSVFTNVVKSHKEILSFPLNGEKCNAITSEILEYGLYYVAFATDRQILEVSGHLLAILNIVCVVVAGLALVLIYNNVRLHSLTEREREKVSLVVNVAKIMTFEVSPDKRIVATNKIFLDRLGMERIKQTTSLFELIPHASRPDVSEALSAAIQTEGQRIEIPFLTSTGDVVVGLWTVNNLYDGQRGIYQKSELLGIDMTEIIEYRDRIHKLAYSDALTGLANKLCFLTRADEIITRAKRRSALIFIDMDNFKKVNDTYGHLFGDEYIIKFSECITSISDEKTIVARFGGDELTVLMYDLENKSKATKYADNILHVLANDVIIDGVNLKASASIGIAYYPDDASNFEDLMKHADVAMYLAKERGKGQYAVYSQNDSN